MKEKPFWKTTPLDRMTRAQWESLCDGCARCCLHKLEDEETGEVFYTDVACRLLNLETCRCTRYADRRRLVPTCLPLTPQEVTARHWLPDSCAYRRLARNQDLAHWHPLVSGESESVHRAGKSVRGWAVREDRVPPERRVAHIVEFDETSSWKEDP